MNNNRTTISKFEEFFVTYYKDELFYVLENYPIEKSMDIQYEILYNFDLDLADLLIDKPEEVIISAQQAIKNFDPLEKDADINIRLLNIPNKISLNELNSKDYMGKLISTEGIIKSISESSARLDCAVFECKGCMRLCEVEQTSNNRILEPSLCSECGGRNFRLLHDDSKYVDTQNAILTNSDLRLSIREKYTALKIILEDDLVNTVSKYDEVNIIGILKPEYNKKTKNFKKILYVNNIFPLNAAKEENVEDSFDIDDEVSRNSSEYSNWRNNVLNRDKVCQCCGLEKRLHAHHIYGYKEYPEFAYDENNGVTLCQFCHEKYHTVYGLKDINPIKFVEFIKRFGVRNE